MFNSETEVQNEWRLSAPSRGEKLWRNNVGALPDKTGRIVRFGLANESKALNQVLKSSDVIGWRTVTVTPDMVGQKVAIFCSYETKVTPAQMIGDRFKAQRAWLELVRDAGGIADVVSQI